jgi:hypothetical protein
MPRGTRQSHKNNPDASPLRGPYESTRRRRAPVQPSSSTTAPTVDAPNRRAPPKPRAAKNGRKNASDRQAPDSADANSSAVDSSGNEVVNTDQEEVATTQSSVVASSLALVASGTESVNNYEEVVPTVSSAIASSTSEVNNFHEEYSTPSSAAAIPSASQTSGTREANAHDEGVLTPDNAAAISPAAQTSGTRKENAHHEVVSTPRSYRETTHSRVPAATPSRLGENSFNNICRRPSNLEEYIQLGIELGFADDFKRHFHTSLSCTTTVPTSANLPSSTTEVLASNPFNASSSSGKSSYPPRRHESFLFSRNITNYDVYRHRYATSRTSCTR